MKDESILKLKHAAERLKTEAYAGTMAGDTARDLDMIALIDGVPELVREIKRLRQFDSSLRTAAINAWEGIHFRAQTDDNIALMAQAEMMLESLRVKS